MPSSEYGCPLNGCRNKTSDPRRPCDGCLALAGDLIRPSATGVGVEEFLRDSAGGDMAVHRVLEGRGRQLAEMMRAAEQAEAEAQAAARLAMEERERAVRRAQAEIEELAADRAGDLAAIRRPPPADTGPPEEKPCACGGVIRRRRRHGSWPSSCDECATPAVRKWREQRATRAQGRAQGRERTGKRTSDLSAGDLTEEAVHLVEWCGLSRGEAAARLGVSRGRLDASLAQARDAA